MKFIFIERLLVLCKEKETDISNVLRELGLSTSKGTAWRRGSIPNGETLIALANYFDVSVDYLLDRTDNPSCLSGSAGLRSEVSYSAAGQAELNRIFLSLNAEGRELLLGRAITLSTQDEYLASPSQGLKNA